MKMTRLIAAGLAALGPTAAAGAAPGDYKAPEHHHWHHAGPFGTYDRTAVQRGYQVYVEVCASCHAMDLLSFRNLGERGGPFEDDRFPNANDNPMVMQLAASYTRQWNGEIDDAGDPRIRPGIPADAFPAPYENDAIARGSNGGALPPDLSVITKARHHGTDYVRSLMLGYVDAPYDVDLGPGQYYNEYFGPIAMPPQLSDGLLEYADGTEATAEQMAEDVAVFLTWAGDPHMDLRKQTGLMVLLFLFVLTILVYLAYRQVWANVKH